MAVQSLPMLAFRTLARGALAASLLLLMGCGSDADERVDPRGTGGPVAAEQPQSGEPPPDEPPSAPDQEASAEPPEIERPYEEGVDAQAQIDAAVAASAEDGKRVLLVFGANWCHWCRRLDWVFQNEPRVSSALEADYRVVHVDTGARGGGVNAGVTARYGDPQSNGLPCLVVLDAEGGVAHTQETGALEEGDHHDPALVLAFLSRFANRG